MSRAGLAGSLAGLGGAAGVWATAHGSTAREIRWSARAQSTCPVMMGMTVASQAAASASGPVGHQAPGPATVRARDQRDSAREPAAAAAVAVARRARSMWA